MGKSQEIQVVVHYPKTEEGMRQLSRRVAEAHADAVIHKINGTRCSVKERVALMRAVTNAAKAKPAVLERDHEISR